MTDETKLQRAIKWCRAQYRARINDHAHHASFLADEILAEAEVKFDLGTFGVEGFPIDEGGRAGVHYLNTGDSYGRTILAVADRWSVRWSLGSWGDLVERMERKGG